MAWVVDRAECSSEIFVNRSNDHDAIHQTHRHRACPWSRSKTLEELEGIKLTEPVVPMTPLVQKVHRLYSVPVEAFSTENLRLMIGQQCGLPYLVPIALEALDADPWVSGDLYRGDLLQSVLRVAPEFWIARSDLFDTLFDIFSELSHQKQLMETELRPAWVRIFRALYGGDPTF
jgi:CDI immunity proteins